MAELQAGAWHGVYSHVGLTVHVGPMVCVGLAWGGCVPGECKAGQKVITAGIRCKAV